MKTSKQTVEVMKETAIRAIETLINGGAHWMKACKTVAASWKGSESDWFEVVDYIADTVG